MDIEANDVHPPVDRGGPGETQLADGPDRIGTFLSQIRMAGIGLAIAVGYFLYAAIFMWGLLGFGIAALVRLFVPDVAHVSLIASVGLTVGPFFLVLALLRAIFKQPRKAQVARMLSFIAKLYPPSEDASALERRRYHASLPVALRFALTGLYLSSLIIIIGFAATVTLAYCELYGPSDLFNVKNGDPSALSIVQHFLFWLNVPTDMLLFEAPSTYGIRLSDLQTNGMAYGFLTFVLFFRVVLVSAVVNLVYLVVTTRLDPDSDVTYEEVMSPAH